MRFCGLHSTCALRINIHFLLLDALEHSADQISSFGICILTSGIGVFCQIVG